MSRSHFRTTASLIGAAALTSLALAPAVGATLVSQSGANAVFVSVADNGSGSGNVAATNDGSRESTTGDTRPPVSVLKGQQVLNAGTLAQEAVARSNSTSAACAGIAGNGASVAEVGDSNCLGGGTPLKATLGSLDLSKIKLAAPGSALDPLNVLADPLKRQLLDPANAAIQQALSRAQQQLGNAGLSASLGVVEGRCTAGPGTASGFANIADTKVDLALPGQDVTLLNLPVDPPPNTHVFTDLSKVGDAVLAAVRTDLTTSLKGVGAPLTEVTDEIRQQIVDNVLTQVEKNLAPLEQNLLDITLNQQVRPTQDSIKVRAFDLKLLPVAKAQLGAPALNLQIGNAACGPAGRVAQPAAAPPAAQKAALPTSVSAGLASAPAQATRPGESSDEIILGAMALLALVAGGVVVFRRPTA